MQRCSCVSSLCQGCFCASSLCHSYTRVIIYRSGLYAALDYMRLRIICGSRLYAALDRMFVRGRESKVCVGIRIGRYALVLRSISWLPLKLRIEGMWAVG